MTLKMLSFIVSLFLIVGMTSCGGGGDKEKDDTKDEQANVSKTKSETTETTEEVGSVTIDLTDMSVPLIVEVPEGVEVNEGMMMGDFDGVKTYNYELKKDGWIMELTMMDESPYTDKAGYMADYKDIVKSMDGFEEIVEEGKNGFIYKVTNEDGEDYNFYYVVLKDDRAIEYEDGLKVT
ncbi:MAG: hypothetical protein PF590_07540, partial [Candidatus Delongbacteria bacterium]|nr:hypothetical protein [Candidatus Delongbacteria bacterium]